LTINRINSDTLAIEESIAFNLVKGEKILVWSDMNLHYDAKVKMFFDLFIHSSVVELGRIQIDPRKKDLRVHEVRKHINGVVGCKYQGKASTIELKRTAYILLGVYFMQQLQLK
jgi:hypothetical protein